MPAKLDDAIVYINDRVPPLDLRNGLEDIRLSIKDGKFLMEAIVADNDFNHSDYINTKVSIAFPVSDLEVDDLPTSSVDTVHDYFDGAVVLGETDRLNIILDDVTYNFKNTNGTINIRNGEKRIVNDSLVITAI